MEQSNSAISSDEELPGSNPDGDNLTEPDGNKSYSEEEFGKVVAQRQRWKALSDEKDSLINDLQSQLKEKKPKRDAKDPDLESLKHKVGVLEESNIQLREQLTKATIDRDVLDIAGKQISKPNLFLTLNRERFEPFVDTTDGKTKTRVKNSGLSVDDLVSEFLTEYPELKLNTRKEGTGNPQAVMNSTNGSSAQNVGLPSNFDAFSQDQKMDFFKNNPGVGANDIAKLLNR